MESLQLSHSRFCFGALRKERSEKRHHGGIRASRRNAVPSLIVSPGCVGLAPGGSCGYRSQLTLLPQIEANGTMRAAVLPISAELADAPVNGRWA